MQHSGTKTDHTKAVQRSVTTQEKKAVQCFAHEREKAKTVQHFYKEKDSTQVVQRGQETGKIGRTTL